MPDPAKKYPITEIQGPDYRSTAPVNKPTQVEIMLGEMRTEMRERFEDQANLLMDVGQRVSSLEAAEARREERARKHSGGIARVSENDSKQDAAIGVLVSDVANLKETQATQLAILKRLDAVAANPMVRRVAYAVGGAVLAYLAAKGYR